MGFKYPNCPIIRCLHCRVGAKKDNYYYWLLAIRETNQSKDPLKTHQIAIMMHLFACYLTPNILYMTII